MKQQLNLKYNGDFDNVVSIVDLKNQVIINALCFTNNLAQVSLETGLSERTIHLFCKQHNLNSNTIKQMRLKFKASGIKIKKRFNYES
jgi:hypothetical protein